MFPDLTRDEVFRIETPRLWLRWPRAGDADRLQAVVSVAEVAEMTATWPHPLPAGEAARRIAQMRQENAAGTGMALALTLKPDPDTLIGCLGVGAPAGDRVLRLGYLLGVSHHRRGLMTEAVRGLVSMVFLLRYHHAIRAETRLMNRASRRVLEKCGFRHLGVGVCEAPGRCAGVDADRFELTREAWRMMDARAAA
jgi:RimJ/RimL family protein N-acetyltransferase